MGYSKRGWGGGHTGTEGGGSRRDVRTYGHLAASVVGVKGQSALRVKVVVCRAPASL